MSSIARKHGISRQTVSAWKQEGVDLTDPQAVADRLTLMREKTSQPTLSEERRRKLRADADLAELNVRKAKGLLIPRAEVHAEMQRVGTVFRGAVKRLEADLPDLLDGMSASQMTLAIGQKCDEVLRGMVEEYRKVEALG